MQLSFLSLFTGIGGFDLGLERAGLRCAGQVEIDPYCRAVLARHWPGVPRFADVRAFNRSSLHEQIDAIVGGFPCQDISHAGHKIGIVGARSGLWSEQLRIIRALRPSYAIVENVAALRTRGLDVVLADLAASGFDAEWDCLPAAAIGAPHLRDRLFLVAYAKRLGRPRSAFFPPLAPGQSGSWPSAKDSGLGEVVGRQQRRLPEHLRMDDGPPARVDARMRGCGNAVVPQLAEWLGRQLLTFHTQFLPPIHPQLHRSAPPAAQRAARRPRLTRLPRLPKPARFSRAARFAPQSSNPPKTPIKTDSKPL